MHKAIIPALGEFARSFVTGWVSVSEDAFQRHVSNKLCRGPSTRAYALAQDDSFEGIAGLGKHLQRKNLPESQNEKVASENPTISNNETLHGEMTKANPVARPSAI
jgi:hypothetical protein